MTNEELADELSHQWMLGEYGVSAGATIERFVATIVAERDATIASLREEVETLKMLLPPVGSITFPPGCDEYPDARLVADLRSRLRIMAPMVCEGCGCARAVFAQVLCVDCEEAQWGIPRGAPVGDWGDRAAACLSVGLRALCGRRILEGC